MSSVYGGNYYDSSVSGGSSYESISTTYNHTNYTTVSVDETNDRIVNTGNYVTIYGGSGNDTLNNSGDNVLIFGESGNDDIKNGTGDSLSSGPSYASIHGGAGNDTINNSGDNVLIFGDEGDDYIRGSYGSSSLSSSVNYVSMAGGAGNDTLVGSTGVDSFFYSKSDGADVIENASSSDVVYLYDVNLADVTSLNTANNKISIGLSTGGSVQISSSENISSVLTLADNSSFKFNHSTNQWLATSYTSGTADADVFNYSKNNGDYIINNASSSDTVNLYDVSITDITSLDTSNNKISIGLSNGGNVQVNSSENLSAKFNLASGGSFQFNHSTSQWQSA